MSEEKNLDKKTLQDLEKEKLQAEVDILKAQLAAEYPDARSPKWYDKLAMFARKWSAFILGSVTLISAIFGVFIPLTQYLDERRNALKYDLNENMIGFVEDLSSDDPKEAQRGIEMLGYYEMNSIPILLYTLSKEEKPENDNMNSLRSKIIENIHWIHFDNKRNDIVEMVMGRIHYNVDKLKEQNEEGNYVLNQVSLRAIVNYIDLLKVLKLSSRECGIITDNFEQIVEEMEMDSAQFYTDPEKGGFGIPGKFKVFLESGEYCN